MTNKYVRTTVGEGGHPLVTFKVRGARKDAWGHSIVVEYSAYMFRKDVDVYRRQFLDAFDRSRLTPIGKWPEDAE